MPRSTLRARTRRIALAVVAAAGALLLPIAALVVAAPATAGGSDSAPPYTVTAAGVTLAEGQTLRANGHVNAQVIPLSQYTPGETYRARGADWTPMQVTRHFDPNDGQPGGAYIGRSFYPFSGAQQQLPAEGYCVIWVQVDGFDEHFGEGGQDPICTTPPATEEPTPSEPTPSEPTPSEPSPFEPAVVHPEIQDYLAACDAAFVLDNSSSTVDVTYTVNGVAYLVPAGRGIHTDADGTRIAPVDGRYVITTDTGRTWTFAARPCVVAPQIQDYVAACDAAFVLDNGASTVDVTYTVNGVAYRVPAGTGVHTDADGTRIAPVDGQYVITTDTGRTWTFAARACPMTPNPSEPTPSMPTPSGPTPSDPTPSAPMPSEPGTDAPAVDPPVDPSPSEEPPATEEPTGGEQPTTEQPTTEQPTTEQPTTEQPTTEQPTTGQPATEVPTEVGAPAASVEPVAAAPTPVASQPTPSQAVAQQESALPRTGAEPLLLVVLVGGLLVAMGAAARIARR